MFKVFPIFILSLILAQKQINGQFCDCFGQERDPICGQDWVTYANKCELKCRNATKMYSGTCEEYRASLRSDDQPLKPQPQNPRPN